MTTGGTSAHRRLWIGLRTCLVGVPRLRGRASALRVGALAILAVWAVVFPLTPGHGEDAPPQAPVADEVSRSAVPSWAKVSAAQTAEAKRLKVPVAFENPIGMRFVLIPAGTFTMGSPASEVGRGDEEGPQHAVTLSKAFYLSIHETTNAQYRRFKSAHDSGKLKEESLNGDAQPVVEMSHDDATAFLSWLNARDRSHVYALPTEAQWEYACRAATTTSRFWGEADSGARGFANVLGPKALARFEFSGEAFAFDDDFLASSPVGAFRANAWGLHDMLGNVSEWVADWLTMYSNRAATDPTGRPKWTHRVLRGGSWGYDPISVRAAYRDADVPDARDDDYGFRVAAALVPR